MEVLTLACLLSLLPPDDGPVCLPVNCCVRVSCVHFQHFCEAGSLQ